MRVPYAHILSPLLSLSLSAGIGRTGAFCALSTAIERVKAEGIVDVFHTIKHLRTQRPHMVQTVVSKPFFHPFTIQWNPSITDILGTAENVLVSEVYSFQGYYTALFSWDQS